MTYVACPHCGEALEVHITPRGGVSAPTMKRRPTQERRYTTARPLSPHVYGAVAGTMQREQWDEIIYETPHRAPTREGDVIVPAMQAGISGALMGGVIFVVSLGLSVWQKLPWWFAPGWGVVVGVGAFAWEWFDLLNDSRSLLRKVETYVRQDLDGDGIIGPQPAPVEQRTVVDVEPEPASREVAHGVTVSPTAQRRPTSLSLPVRPEQLRNIAIHVLPEQRGENFSRRSLSEILSESEYEDLQTSMIDLSLLRWRENKINHPSGPELTGRGRSVLRKALS